MPLREGLMIVLEEAPDTGEGIYEFESGKALAERFLRCCPEATAILTVNDVTAFGIIQTLTNAGVKVPEDVSVVGFDNIYISPMITPGLTTVSIPAVKMGSDICDTLIEHMKREERFDGFDMRFAAELVVRDSVKDIS